MDKRKVHIRPLDHDQAAENRAYWLSRPPAERLAALGSAD
jgi:hypothetical protein